MSARFEHRLGPPAPPNGQDGGVILLVEDDPETLRVTAYFLHELGYRTLEAAGALEAVELARENRAVIGLLVTDVAMPVMSGIELAQRVRRELPELPVIFLAGLVVPSAGELPGIRFLRKPFSKRELAVLLRSTLAGAGAALEVTEMRIASFPD